MSDAQQHQTLPQLQILGDADAASCDGEVCVLPENRDHAIMNRRLDEDLV